MNDFTISFNSSDVVWDELVDVLPVSGLALLDDGSFVASLALLPLVLLLFSEEFSVKPVDMLPVDGGTGMRMQRLTCGGAWRYRLQASRL